MPWILHPTFSAEMQSVNVSSSHLFSLKRKSVLNMSVVRNIYFSFPFQLGLLHVRKFLFMLLPWMLLTLMVTGNFGSKFGLNYLFLDPEYLGRVSALSFFMV